MSREAGRALALLASRSGVRETAGKCWVSSVRLVVELRLRNTTMIAGKFTTGLSPNFACATGR
jgi:hypothetical protein